MGKLKVLLTLGIGTFILMIVGFYNGYPLVYSDTGTYIGSGFAKFVPVDRAIPYGLFIYFFSFFSSLWGIILIQNFITAFVIYQIFKVLDIKEKRFVFNYFFILAFLVLFTGIGWYSNQIMPDFFAPISILSIYVLLKGNKLKWHVRFAITLILLLSLISHFSHLMIGTVLIVLIFGFHFLFRRYFQEIPIRRIINVSIIVFSSWILLPSINFLVEKKFFLSKGSHVFLMSHLVDTGILEKFLKENCSKDEFKDCKLCEYKDSLPNNLPAFLWAGNILENTGGYLNSKEEYSKIIKATLTKPKYLGLNIWESFSYGIIQLTKNNIGDGLSAYNKGSAPYVNVSWRFPDELNNYSNSRQNIWNGLYLKLDVLNTFQLLILIFSLLIIIGIFSTNILFKLDSKTVSFLIFVLTAILLNSFVTAGLNSPNDRFQARVVWMLPLALLILISRNYKILFKKVLKKIESITTG